MIHIIERGMIAAACAAFALTAVAADAPTPKTSFFEQAKITINDRARAAGFLRVRLQPENGEAREATIDIHKRMSENDIAKTLAKALQSAVGSEYDVDRTAGEHVKIRKAKRGAPNFSVEITFNSPGFSIVLDK